MSVALSVSSAGHLLLFAALWTFVSFELEPAMFSRPLVLNLRSRLADDGLATTEALTAGVANEDAAAPPGPDPSDPAPTPARQVPDPMPIDNVGVAEPVQRPDAAMSRASESAPAHAAPGEAPAEAPSSPLAGPRVVTTEQPRDRRTHAALVQQPAPEVEKIALSRKELKMLTRELERWEKVLIEMPPGEQLITWKHRGQEYTASIRRVPAGDDTGLERVVAEVSKEAQGNRMSTELMMKRLAFSNFAQFVNRWDSGVQIHNDEVDGRFHSNTGINVFSSPDVQPKFLGKVTTASGRVNFAESRWPLRREQIFLGGIQTGVRAIPLPRRFAPFPGTQPGDEAQVHRFESDAQIRFYTDGSYGWRNGDDAEQRMPIADDGAYLVGSGKTTLHVAGTVRGKVLVYSPERIVITGDLTYARHPEMVPDSGDYLGLVSDKYVDIAGPRVTGPGDLNVHASIYAARRFRVRSYNSRDDALLTIYGSVSVGSLSATEPRYRTRMIFDKRLEEVRPPGFPMTSRYEVESWDGRWRVDTVEAQ